MTFVIDTTAKAAFKKLYGKAHTSNSKDVANESEPSNISLTAQTIFADTVPSTGSAAVNAGVAASVNILLVLDASSNGKAYKAQITGSVPSGLVGKINPVTGTTYATGQRVGFFIPEYLGADFRVRLKDGATEIPPLAAQDWVFDYYAGIVTSEDNLVLSSGNVDGYIYIGAFLTATGSNWASEGNDIYNRNTGSVLVRKDLAVHEDGYVEGQLGVGSTTTVDITNSRTRLFVKSGNIAIEDNGGVYVPALDIRGSAVSADQEVGIIGFGNWQSTASEKRTSKIAGLTSNPYDAESGQLAFSVADSSGTLREAMRLDEAGRLGVGTIAPTSLLHVRSQSSGGTLITLDYDNTSASIGQILGRIEWAGNDASGGASGARVSVQGVYRGTAGATALEFYTTADSSSTLQHIMSLNSDQRVGVGITAPDCKLHVMQSDASTSSNSNAIATLEKSGVGYLQFLTPDANENGILFGLTSNNASGGIIYNNSATATGLQIRTGGNNTRLVIDSAGLVGVGTTAPGARLHVSSGSSAWAIWGSSAASSSLMTFRQPSSTSAAGYLGTGGGGAVTAGSVADLALRSDSSLMLASGGNNPRITITSLGEVGIGVTSPTERLVVNNGTSLADIFVAQENGTQVFSLPDGMLPPTSAQKVLCSIDTSGNAEWNDINYLRFLRSFNSFFNHEEFVGNGYNLDGGGDDDNDGWGIWSSYEYGGADVGQLNAAPVDVNHPGVAVLSTVNATDRASIQTYKSLYGPSSNSIFIECMVRFSNVNHSSNNWTFKFGISSSRHADVDGLDEVSISIDAGSNNLRAKIISNSSVTYNNLLGVTVTANTWYRLRILFYNSIVLFTCSDGGIGALTAVASTPSTDTMYATVAYNRTSSTGSTYNCYIDYVALLLNGLVRG